MDNQPSTYSKIANALQGFGAGVAGQGPYFMHVQQQQQQQLSEGRKMALLQDAYTVQQNLQTGNIPAARATLINRLSAIRKLGGDPSDTMGVLQKIEDGDIEGAHADVSAVVNYGQAAGLLKLPQSAQPKTQIVNGQAVTVSPQGKATASPIEGFVAPQAKQNLPKTQIVNGQLVTTDPVTGQATASPVQGLKQDPMQVADLNSRAADRALRSRALDIQQQAESRMGNKMSAGLEKVMLDSSQKTVDSQKKANQFDMLANDFEKLKIQGGLKANATESLKAIMGTQDDVSEYKRQFNQVRLSEVLKNLPPGAASDADIKNAMQGLPKEHASPEQITSFLRGAAKVARFEAGFNQFRADYIGNKSDGKGLNQAWRSKVNSPSLKRDVSIAELYETAQNRGTTPEDVAQQLGIKGSLY